MPLHKLNSGVDFAFGEKLLHTDMNIVRQNSADGSVSTDSPLSGDSDHTLDLTTGTTYLVTLTLSQNRTVNLPSGVIEGSRAYFKTTMGSSGFDLIFHDLTGGGATVATIVCAGTGTTEGFIDFVYLGGAWRTMYFRDGANQTTTVSQ